MHTTIKRISFVLISLFYSLMELVAQSPTHIDTRRKDPKPFTLDDILVYIVFPILLFAFVLFLRRYQKKLQERKNASDD